MEILINNLDKEFIIDTNSVTVSSGFYVRQFVFDFARTFDVTATTFHIKRTRVGDFSVEDGIEQSKVYKVHKVYKVNLTRQPGRLTGYKDLLVIT